MTSRLNLRIRLSYALVQLISPLLSAMRLAAPIKAILICEKLAPLIPLFLYYSPRVGVHLGIGNRL